MEWQRSRSAVRNRDGVVGSQEYGGRAFVPKRSITAEQTRRLIEEHFATIARRTTPQNLIKKSCGTGPGGIPHEWSGFVPLRAYAREPSLDRIRRGPGPRRPPYHTSAKIAQREHPLALVAYRPLAFKPPGVIPALPACLAYRPPSGPHWEHEVKSDGYRGIPPQRPRVW